MSGKTGRDTVKTPRARADDAGDPQWLEQLDFFRARIKLEGTDYYVQITLVDADTATQALTALAALGMNVQQIIDLVQGAGEDVDVGRLLSDLQEQARRDVIAPMWEQVDAILVRCVSDWKLPGCETAPAALGEYEARREIYGTLPLRLLGRIIEGVVLQSKNL